MEPSPDDTATLRAMVRAPLCIPYLEAESLYAALEQIAESLARELGLASPAVPSFVNATASECLEALIPLGSGMALPHAHRTEAPTPLLAVAHLARPVEGPDESLDLLLVLISPRGDYSRHLEALKGVAAAVREESLPNALRAARTAEEMLAVLLGDGARED